MGHAESASAEIILKLQNEREKYRDRPRKGRRFSDDTKKLVIEAKNFGLSAKRIHRVTGISKSAIAKWTRKKVEKTQKRFERLEVVASHDLPGATSTMLNEQTGEFVFCSGLRLRIFLPAVNTELLARLGAGQ